MFPPGIKVKISEHESGGQKTYFSSFECQPISKDHFAKIFARARLDFGIPPITQVYLTANQSKEREVLEEMGFGVDGIKYSIDALQLKQISEKRNHVGLQGYQIRAFNFDQDIDGLVQMEKTIHAADKTSRVKFDTDASIQSMKEYYRRISNDNGVYLLVSQDELVGVVGFMRQSKDSSSVQISSVGLALDHQGKGLFFPFVAKAWQLSPYNNLKTLTGVTTTRRLVSAAEKYGAKVLGFLLTRFE